MDGVESVRRNVWKKRLEEYAETRLCSVKLVKESVLIWRTMENHEKFLRLGAFSLSKKKKIIVVYHAKTVHTFMILVLMFCRTQLLFL